MNVLAIDTCFGACSAAVWSHAEARIMAERCEFMDKGHSERIVPMIAEVLTEAGVGMAGIGGLAVTVGPGTFTGVRTGLAVVRGLALARGLDVRGTTSLHVMAASLRDEAAGAPVAIAVATRDGLVYFQMFAPATMVPAAPAALLTPAEAADRFGTQPHLVGGSGAELVVAAAVRGGPVHSEAATEPVVRAAILAALSAGLPLLEPPAPLYLREPDAKPQPGFLPSSHPPRI